MTSMVGMAAPGAGIPDFSVKVNGANLPQQARADVRAVTVEEDLDALSMFSLELYNGDDEKLQVSWSDSTLFAVGNEVEIWLGHVDDLHKVLYFQPPGHAAQASVRLSIGGDVNEFTPRLSSLGQEGQVAVRSWDVMQKRPIVGSAGVGQESAVMGRVSGPAAANRAWGKASTGIVDQPARSKAEADQIALGRFNRLALAHVRGTVACSGRPQLHAGTVVHIDGAGRAFSGPYYVTAVTHTLNKDQGYRTSLTVERNAT